MIERIDEGADNVVGMRLSGKLTDADYKEIVPQFEKAIEKWGKISVLWLMEDFHGWDAHAVWDDLKAWGQFHGKMERIAMVGENRWEKWMTKLTGAFHLADIKYFDHESQEAALEWLRSG